jgi:hypothetical protein
MRNAGAVGDLAHQLDGIAATKVVHPDITYKVGKDGHLVTLAEQLEGEMRTRRAPKPPRQ